VDIVPWERCELSTLPGVPVFALETGGVPLADFPFPRHGILIAGSEELGVSPHALAAADASLGRVSILCYGAKASLNVSVAFGIALQAWAHTLQNFV
jgi:TrmH family RNA methyltransferase